MDILIVLVGILVFVIGFYLLLKSIQGNKRKLYPVLIMIFSVILCATGIIASEYYDKYDPFVTNFAKEYKLDKKSAYNALKASQQVGINIGSVKSMTLVESDVDGDTYAFDYDGYEFTVKSNTDKSVDTLKCGDVVFFSNHVAVDDVRKKLITVEQRSILATRSERDVKSILKSPSTAEFPGSLLFPLDGWDFTRSDNDFCVYSYVDSQNTFGATIRSDFAITYEWDGISDELTVSSLIFDGEKIV